MESNTHYTYIQEREKKLVFFLESCADSKEKQNNRERERSNATVKKTHFKASKQKQKV